MGPTSILEISQPKESPNRLTSTIRPDEANGATFIVSIKSLARQQQESIIGRLGEDFDANANAIFAGGVVGGAGKLGLYTSETVRQEVRLDTEDLRAMPLERDVETTTLFLLGGGRNEVEAVQRTSSYFTWSNMQYDDARGRPFDVRYYHVKYTRKEARS